MPGPILVASAVVQCPHGGTVQLVSVDPRIRFGGAPAVRPGQHPVVGCSFSVGGQASPCLTVVWGGASVRVTGSGQPVVVDPAAGICQGPLGAPQGQPILLSAGQARASAG